MDTINCPHCGEQKDIDLCDYAPEMYHEVACEECGKGIEFSWSCEPVVFVKDTDEEK